MQSECGKIRIKKTPNKDMFSRSKGYGYHKISPTAITKPVFTRNYFGFV